MTNFLPAFSNSISINRVASNSIVIGMTKISAGWSQKFLLRSDAHHDSPKCDRRIETADLQQAVEDNAAILDFGDLHDAMQGKGDPRGNLDDLLPQYKTGKYLDALVEIAAKDYKPYSKQWLLLADGNHETSVRSKKEVDLTERTVAAFRQEKDCYAERGSYAGWITFQFEMRRTVRQSLRLYYCHGFGGNGTGTFGVGQIRTQASYLNDADFIVNGHNHNAYHVPLISLGCNINGKPYDKVIHSIRTPGYKRGYRRDTNGGFEVEKGHAPQPVGCCWLEFIYNGDKIEPRVTVSAK